ncbi:MAG TPA: twin-arginine translocase TatA/TatE family subunit [Actinotalea sp.]|jgi:sec-independent protein translocase protein TatA
MFSGLRLQEVLLILLVVLLLFGANRLPDLARSVGKSLKIFKSEVKDITKDEPAAGPAAAAPTVPGTPGTIPPGATPVPPTTPGVTPDDSGRLGS